jgi:hypothetical protein
MLVETEKNQAVKTELEAKMKALDSFTNAEVANFKKELIKLNEQELGTMRTDLQGYLNGMMDSEINQLGSVLKQNPMYSDLSLDFSSAFTMNEKRNVIQGALMKDLGFLRSVYNKKIGYASKADLKKDLEQNLIVFQNTHSSKGDSGKILQISLIILAGLALVTWGIASAVYGGKLARIKSDRENQLADLKKNLQNQYNLYKDQLTQNELNYLKENGYFRTVCGTFSQPDSILCNRYQYKLFTGNKHCSVYCYKNIDTGKETLHEPAVCTSAFIPTDCYDPQEYWNAYARGDSDGYYDGYDDGSRDGDSDGRSDGRSDGDYDGRDDGYDDGYSDGYNDGYDSGYSGKSLKSFVPFAKSEEYLRGFTDGVEQYQILFLNF